MLPFHVFPSQPKSPEHLTLCSEQEKGGGESTHHRQGEVGLSGLLGCGRD